MEGKPGRLQLGMVGVAGRIIESIVILITRISKDIGMGIGRLCSWGNYLTSARIDQRMLLKVADKN